MLVGLNNKEERMLQKYSIIPHAIIVFLFGISFLHAATGSAAEVQEGARHPSLESKIQDLTQRVDRLKQLRDKR